MLKHPQGDSVHVTPMDCARVDVRASSPRTKVHEVETVGVDDLNRWRQQATETSAMLLAGLPAASCGDQPTYPC